MEERVSAFGKVFEAILYHSQHFGDVRNSVEDYSKERRDATFPNQQNIQYVRISQSFILFSVTKRQYSGN